MSDLFSVAFTAIFVVFGVAAIVGHALLAEALVRPFFGRLAVDEAASDEQRRPDGEPLILSNPEKAVSGCAEIPGAAS